MLKFIKNTIDKAFHTQSEALQDAVCETMKNVESDRIKAREFFSLLTESLKEVKTTEEKNNNA